MHAKTNLNKKFTSSVLFFQNHNKYFGRLEQYLIARKYNKIISIKDYTMYTYNCIIHIYTLNNRHSMINLVLLKKYLILTCIYIKYNCHEDFFVQFYKNTKSLNVFVSLNEYL